MHFIFFLHVFYAYALWVLQMIVSYPSPSPRNRDSLVLKVPDLNGLRVRLVPLRPDDSNCGGVGGAYNGWDRGGVGVAEGLPCFLQACKHCVVILISPHLRCETNILGNIFLYFSPFSMAGAHSVGICDSAWRAELPQ